MWKGKKAEKSEEKNLAKCLPISNLVVECSMTGQNSGMQCRMHCYPAEPIFDFNHSDWEYNERNTKIKGNRRKKQKMFCCHDAL